MIQLDPFLPPGFSTCWFSFFLYLLSSVLTLGFPKHSSTEENVSHSSAPSSSSSSSSSSSTVLPRGPVLVGREAFCASRIRSQSLGGPVTFPGAAPLHTPSPLPPPPSPPLIPRLDYLQSVSLKPGALLPMLSLPLGRKTRKLISPTWDVPEALTRSFPWEVDLCWAEGSGHIL